MEEIQQDPNEKLQAKSVGIQGSWKILKEEYWKELLESWEMPIEGSPRMNIWWNTRKKYLEKDS